MHLINTKQYSKKKTGNRGKLENHHILPRSIFPEYEKENWNIKCVPSRLHCILHFCLYKSIKHNSCIYAFNQMRNRVVNQHQQFNFKLYAQVREEFAKIISENNSGRICDEKTKEHLSEVNRGKTIYRNPETNECKQFKVGGQPAGWIDAKVGTIATDERKQKIGKVHKGSSWQYNLMTKEVKFSKILLAGFTPGFPPWFTASGILCKNTVWVSNPFTGETARLSQHEPLPENYIFGRMFENKGFNQINNSNNIRVLDLLEKKFCLILNSEFDNKRYKKHGGKLHDIYIISYNDKHYVSVSDLNKHNPELPKGIPGKEKIKTFIIPKPHVNSLPIKNKFKEMHGGKTLLEIGLRIIPLSEYIFEEEKIV